MLLTNLILVHTDEVENHQFFFKTSSLDKRYVSKYRPIHFMIYNMCLKFFLICILNSVQGKINSKSVWG